jgi:hypothetical protein
MAQRHRDALMIIEGACNPSGIALAFIDGCVEARKELAFRGTDQLRKDPALRLMTHQLAFLMGVGSDIGLDEYHRCLTICEELRIRNSDGTWVLPREKGAD